VTTLVWFRNDLRVADNPALFDACLEADEDVIAVYLVAAEQHREHGEGDRRLGFLRQNLESLSASLAELHIPLWVASAPRFDNATDALLAIARSTSARALYFNAEYPLNEARRDQSVQRACAASGLACHVRHGDVILPPGAVLKDDDEPYRVFTPFKRRWHQRCSRPERMPLPVPAPRSAPPVVSVPAPEPLDDLPQMPEDPDWPAGEATARQRLDGFLEARIHRYESDRDYPGRSGTSRLSPYLAMGVLSARDAFYQAEQTGAAAASWLNELIWREFYRHIVSLYPHVSRGDSFRRELDSLPWRHDPEGLAAWKAGQTGYPLVDAGMRELAETGFMHNRVRMITAMFLTKHLLVHWREGEWHFMQHLRDGDFASNNGGWQWSASTGTDAAPYFRVFNPESQAKKFDKNNDYIRRYVPELGTPSYPAPIVEHSSARQRALAFFKADPRARGKK
jgi:deoxyribodipyrimidine photo-lyase